MKVSRNCRHIDGHEVCRGCDCPCHSERQDKANRNRRLRDNLAGVLMENGRAETVGEAQALADKLMPILAAHEPSERESD